MGVFSGIQDVQVPVPVQTYRSRSSTSPEHSIIRGDEEGESYPPSFLLWLSVDPFRPLLFCVYILKGLVHPKLKVHLLVRVPNQTFFSSAEFKRAV